MSVANNGTECSEGSREHPLCFPLLCVTEILPPFGRLNDKYYKIRVIQSAGGYGNTRT